MLNIKELGDILIKMIRYGDFSPGVIDYDKDLIDAIIKSDAIKNCDDGENILYFVMSSNKIRKNVKADLLKYICNKKELECLWDKIKKRA